MINLSKHKHSAQNIFNINDHLFCQDCYFSKLFAFRIINNLAVIKLQGFLIGFHYYIVKLKAVIDL